MELEHGIFAVKLCELEREYGHLQGRIQLFQEKRPQQIRRERERVQDEYQEHHLLLEDMARSGRCAGMARLAQLQRDYEQQAQSLLHAGLSARDGDDRQEQAEDMTLYAEFAIDFATQAMRYALIAALGAMELQMQADK